MNTVSDVFKIYHPLENVKGTRESAIIMEILQEERPDWIWGGGCVFWRGKFGIFNIYGGRRWESAETPT